MLWCALWLWVIHVPASISLTCSTQCWGADINTQVLFPIFIVGRRLGTG